MEDNLMVALKNSKSEFEKKTLLHLMTLRDRQMPNCERQSRQPTEPKFSKVLDIRTSSEIHNSQLIDYSQTVNGTDSTRLVPSRPKTPLNTSISCESNDSYESGTSMIFTGSDQEQESLNLSIGFDSQKNQSRRPLNCDYSYGNQHTLKGSDIPKDLADVNMFDSLQDYRVRVIFNRGN